MVEVSSVTTMELPVLESVTICLRFDLIFIDLSCETFILYYMPSWSCLVSVRPAGAVRSFTVSQSRSVSASFPKTKRKLCEVHTLFSVCKSLLPFFSQFQMFAFIVFYCFSLCLNFGSNAL